MVWIYLIVKVIDLLDTIFFVLRKKQNQVTFLHVYHHTGMVVAVWSGVKWFPGGHTTFIGKNYNVYIYIIISLRFLIRKIFCIAEFSGELGWLLKKLQRINLLTFWYISFYTNLISEILFILKKVGCWTLEKQISQK